MARGCVRVWVGRRPGGRGVMRALAGRRGMTSEGPSAGGPHGIQPRMPSRSQRLWPQLLVPLLRAAGQPLPVGLRGQQEDRRLRRVAVVRPACWVGKRNRSHPRDQVPPPHQGACLPAAGGPATAGCMAEALAWLCSCSAIQAVVNAYVASHTRTDAPRRPKRLKCLRPMGTKKHAGAPHDCTFGQRKERGELTRLGEKHARGGGCLGQLPARSAASRSLSDDAAEIELPAHKAIWGPPRIRLRLALSGSRSHSPVFGQGPNVSHPPLIVRCPVSIQSNPWLLCCCWACAFSFLFGRAGGGPGGSSLELSRSRFFFALLVVGFFSRAFFGRFCVTRRVMSSRTRKPLHVRVLRRMYSLPSLCPAAVVLWSSCVCLELSCIDRLNRFDDLKTTWLHPVDRSSM